MPTPSSPESPAPPLPQLPGVPLTRPNGLGHHKTGGGDDPAAFTWSANPPECGQTTDCDEEWYYVEVPPLSHPEEATAGASDAVRAPGKQLAESWCSCNMSMPYTIECTLSDHASEKDLWPPPATTIFSHQNIGPGARAVRTPCSRRAAVPP